MPAFRKARLSAVMAFLVIGALIGPSGLGRLAEQIPWLAAFTFEDSAAARWLAELGVVFLLFVIGLEVSSARLWALRRFMLGLGTSQLFVTSIVIALVALAFGNTLAVAAVTGLALALSSTAVVLQLLAERRKLAAPVGRAGFSVLLLQDLAVVPIFFIIGALSIDASHARPAGLVNVISALMGAALTIAAILLLGRFLLRPLFRWAASIESREVFVATVLLVVIGAAAAAEAAGLSMALGAFLAGLLLAETEFRHEIQIDIEPFKGLLLGLFFVTVGMQIDLALVLADSIRVLVGVIGLFVVKAAILAPLARAFGLPWPRAIELALLLGQAGEFAFVVVAMAREGGIYPDATADYMLLVIAASIFLTPLVATLGLRNAQHFERAERQGQPPEISETERHVVIAGYGRVGQTLGSILQAEEVAHVALDLDADLVGQLRKRGWPVHFGDASRTDVLAAVDAGRAEAIVVTMDNAEAVERVVTAARATWPHVPIYARARDSDQARRLHAAGAVFASPETIEATLQLGEALLNGLGFADDAARRVIDERREAERSKTLLSG